MSQHLSMVSKGSLGKGYIFWPSISGVSWVLLNWCYFRMYVEYSHTGCHTRHKWVLLLPWVKPKQTRCSWGYAVAESSGTLWPQGLGFSLGIGLAGDRGAFPCHINLRKIYIPLDSGPQRARIMCLVEGFLICQALWFVAVQTSETKACLCEFVNWGTPF